MLGRFPRLRAATILGLLLSLAAPAWAEYCKSQGSPSIPKNQVWRYNWRAFLSVEEIVTSEARHLPWGTSASSRWN